MDRSSGIPVVHEKVDLSRDAPEVDIIEAIADLKETPPEELPPLWDCVGNTLEPFSSIPASSNAQVTLSFSYGGYRISVNQNGEALLAPEKSTQE